MGAEIWKTSQREPHGYVEEEHSREGKQAVRESKVAVDFACVKNVKKDSEVVRSQNRKGTEVQLGTLSELSITWDDIRTS